LPYTYRLAGRSLPPGAMRASCSLNHRYRLAVRTPLPGALLVVAEM